jgi:predicted Abi (CAAX) family protease
MIKLFRNRLFFAITTPIDINKFKNILLPIFALITLLLFIGFITRFLRITTFNFTWIEFIKITAISFIMPALSEEIFFRALFLPHPSENPTIKSQILWTIVSTMGFVVYHPIQGILWNPSGYDVFIKPIFLCLAALLGIICTIAYLATGSIWLSVIIHWLAVVIWLFMLDGLSNFVSI